MTDQARSDGLRLLRVMNETPVTPAIAGLEEGSDRYDEAMRFLHNEGAEDEQFSAAVGDYEHGSSAYGIARREKPS
jgi:hypothetical protein